MPKGEPEGPRRDRLREAIEKKIDAKLEKSPPDAEEIGRARGKELRAKRELGNITTALKRENLQATRAMPVMGAGGNRIIDISRIRDSIAARLKDLKAIDPKLASETAKGGSRVGDLIKRLEVVLKNFPKKAIGAQVPPFLDELGEKAMVERSKERGGT